MVIPIVIIVVMITWAVPTSESSWSKDRDRYKNSIYLLNNEVVNIKSHVQLRSFKNTKYITKEIDNNPKSTNHLDIVMSLIEV